MWLTDGAEMPESGQSKRDRVKAAREKVGVDIQSVKVLLHNHFNGATDPTQLTTQQVDKLIGVLKAIPNN
jgi:hypothetical protein